MSEINKPAECIYYILVGDAVHHGCVMPNQVMNSQIEDLRTFTDEQDWVDALLVLGITLGNEII
mgnify:FL=1|tara:strand:- start:2423 stop:2614 length:192 start_codon:yes stop_codon:yes gene_type:complete